MSGLRMTGFRRVGMSMQSTCLLSEATWHPPIYGASPAPMAADLLPVWEVALLIDCPPTALMSVTTHTHAVAIPAHHFTSGRRFQTLTDDPQFLLYNGTPGFVMVAGEFWFCGWEEPWGRVSPQRL